jgi:hypothetical protein
MVMIGILVTVFAVLMPLAAQDHQHHEALNARGKQFMGFDQEATAHHFILTNDGGRIEVSARAADDATSPGQIRAHLQHITQAFTSGDFSVPALVHDQKVPGVTRMKAAGTALTYTFEATNRGGLIRISGSTPDAVAAAHEFLKFQIKDHGTGDPLVVK